MPLINDRIRLLKPYDVQTVDEGEIKLDAMENPYLLPEDVSRRISAAVADTKLNRYPDPGYRKLKKLISKYCGASSKNILVGNGSDELILSVLIAAAGPDRTVVSPSPTFSMYKILSRLTDSDFINVPLEDDFKLPVKKILSMNPDVTFITYPNNPTGNCFSRSRIKKIIENTGGIVIIDEAY
jgi:histidinol-phosphate aminotransferase